MKVEKSMKVESYKRARVWQVFLETRVLVSAPAPIKAPMLVPLAPPHRQLLPVLPHQLPAHRRSMSAFTIVMLKSKLRVMFSWKVGNLQRKQSCQVNNFFHHQLLLLVLQIPLLLSLLLPLLLLTAALAPGLTEVLGQVAAGRQEEEEEMQEGATSTFASSKVPAAEKLDASASSRGGLSGGRGSARVRGGATGSRQERPKKVSPPPSLPTWRHS